MNRKDLEQFIFENYSAEPEHLWAKYPNYEVFRHNNNRKWFALIADISKNKLGLDGNDILDVVNFKCDPVLIDSLRGKPGFFPAYHMNKSKWITVALDGRVSKDEIKMLLDMSFEMTSGKLAVNKIHFNLG